MSGQTLVKQGNQSKSVVLQAARCANAVSHGQRGCGGWGIGEMGEHSKKKHQLEGLVG